MRSGDKIKISLRRGSDYLGVYIGNQNIIRNHISYFEKRAIEEIKQNGSNLSFSEYPNFGVWLRLNAEHITNKLFYELARVNGADISEILDNIRFKDLVAKSEEILKKNDIGINNLSQKVESVNLVVEFSHCIRHGGIPNISKKIKNVSSDAIIKMLDPKYFNETKKIFVDAGDFADHLPKPKLIVSCMTK